MRAWWGTIAMGLALTACEPRTPKAEVEPAPKPRPMFAEDRAAWDRYLAQAREADAIADPVARCEAYPDLPGNEWPMGAAKTRCVLLREPQWQTLEPVEAMLAKPNGGRELDAHYAQVLKAHYEDPQQREALFREYRIWDETDKAGRLAETWRKQSPDSPYALLALGRYYVEAGKETRGEDVIGKTSRVRLEGMERQLDLARPLLERALSLEPKLTPGYDSLLDIAAFSGNDELRAAVIEAYGKTDPGSWSVMVSRQHFAEDKWGGSAQERDRIAQDIRERQGRYPLLASLNLSAEQLEAIAQARNGNYEATRATLEEASRSVPEPRVLGHAGVAAYYRNEHQRGLGYLSQSLRFNPDSLFFLHKRASLFNWFFDYESALRDAQRAAKLGSTEGHLFSTLGYAAEKLGRLDVAREAYEKAMETKDQRQYAFRKFCQLQITPELFADKAVACTEALMKEFPDDRQAIFMRAWVMMDVGDPDAVQMAERFLAVADANDTMEASFAKQLRERMGQK